MTERLNPFGFSAFGHYSQGVKIDLGTKTIVRNEFFATARPASTMVEISNTVAKGCDAEIEVMAIIDNA